MAKPQTKADHLWLTELRELDFVKHGRRRRSWIKRQLNRAIRRAAKQHAKNEAT